MLYDWEFVLHVNSHLFGPTVMRNELMSFNSNLLFKSSHAAMWPFCDTLLSMLEFLNFQFYQSINNLVNMSINLNTLAKNQREKEERKNGSH